jgi:hypothetical protein
MSETVHWEEDSLQTIWQYGGSTHGTPATVKSVGSLVTVFYRVFELKEETAIFIHDIN